MSVMEENKEKNIYVLENNRKRKKKADYDEKARPAPTMPVTALRRE